MNKTLLLSSLLFCNYTSFAQEHNPQHHQSDKVVLTEVINGSKVYGNKWTQSAESLAIDKAILDQEMILGEEMIFTGNITKVCQKRGCWMVLESNGQFARVDFNRHSFFIPKDTQGTAEVFGVMHSKLMSDEKRKHLEEEGSGKLAEKVYEITATSVKIHP